MASFFFCFKSHTDPNHLTTTTGVSRTGNDSNDQCTVEIRRLRRREQDRIRHGPTFRTYSNFNQNKIIEVLATDPNFTSEWEYTIRNWMDAQARGDVKAHIICYMHQCIMYVDDEQVVSECIRFLTYVTYNEQTMDIPTNLIDELIKFLHYPPLAPESAICLANVAYNNVIARNYMVTDVIKILYVGNLHIPA